MFNIFPHKGKDKHSFAEGKVRVWGVQKYSAQGQSVR